VLADIGGILRRHHVLFARPRFGQTWITDAQRSPY